MLTYYLHAIEQIGIESWEFSQLDDILNELLTIDVDQKVWILSKLNRGMQCFLYSVILMDLILVAMVEGMSESPALSLVLTEYLKDLTDFQERVTAHFDVFQRIAKAEEWVFLREEFHQIGELRLIDLFE